MSRTWTGLVVVAMGMSAGSLPAVSRADDAPTIKWNLLAQGWFFDQTATFPNTNFRIRRAEVKLSGSVVENTRWFLQVDAAKTLSAAGDNNILQDIGIGYTLTEGLELVVGQFKVQTTSESLESSSELLFPERSVEARVYGENRQPGAALMYKKDILKAAVMWSNGVGTNQYDNNNKHDLSARVEVEALPMLSIGAFTRAGDMSWSDNGTFGGGAKFKQDKLLVRAEFGTNGLRNAATGLKTTGNGLVADAGYMLNDHWQVAGRFDLFKPDTGVDASGRAETVGLNCFLAGHKQKVQAAFVFMDGFKASNGALPGSYAGNPVTVDTKGSIFVLNFQAAL